MVNGYISIELTAEEFVEIRDNTANRDHVLPDRLAPLFLNALNSKKPVYLYVDYVEKEDLDGAIVTNNIFEMYGPASISSLKLESAYEGQLVVVYVTAFTFGPVLGAATSRGSLVIYTDITAQGFRLLYRWE